MGLTRCKVNVFRLGTIIWHDNKQGDNKVTNPENAKHPRNLLTLLTAMALSSLIAAHAQSAEEVPLITSPDNVTLEMLTVAGVKRGDHVIDLSSGDGCIVLEISLK